MTTQTTAYRSARGALFAAMIGLGGVMTSAGAALACACCADVGQRTEMVVVIDAFLASELERLRPEPIAVIRNAAGGEDIAATLVIEKIEGVWVFSFTTINGAVGTLSARMPQTLDFIAVDETPTVARQNVELAKVATLASATVATGFFAGDAGTAAAQAIMSIEGRGNNCTDAAQFTGWRVDVNVGDDSYQIFGALGPVAPES